LQLELEPLEQRLLLTGDFTKINALLAGAGYSSAAWGDYNSDGHLDLAIGGQDQANEIRFTQVYLADGSGGFALDTNANLPPLSPRGSLAWGDYNNDGHLDLVVNGQDTTTNTALTQIYKGDGDGGFSLDANANLPGVSTSSMAWGDCNNDGHLDLVISGTASQPTPSITEIYLGDGEGGFTLDANADLPGLEWGSVAWGDYNNDGNIDLAASGFDSNHNNIALAYAGDGDGGFTLDASANLIGGQKGSMAWGDYNSDGFLDLALCGFTTNKNVSRVASIYTGDGNGKFTLDAKVSLPGIAGGSMAWGDFNNDGHLDLILNGIDNDINYLGQVYAGDGTGGFTLDANAILVGLGSGSAAWGDYSDDGRLDLVVTGFDASTGTNAFTEVYQNTSAAQANTAPLAPANLSTTIASSSSVTFSWAAATDDKTASAGLSYALRVGTTPGAADIINPMSNLLTGQRAISSFGLIQGTSYTLGGLSQNTTYYWSVQAVDGGLEGGAFATEQSFSLSSQGDQAPSITSANKTSFVVGSAGSFTVTVTGTPKPTLAESGALPGGVTFNAATGLLSGTPASGTSGTYTVTFTASNGVGADAVQTFTLTVKQSPTFTSVNQTSFAVGGAGSFTVTAIGFPAPILSESGAMPSGVTFNPATGLLSGMPAPGTNGTYTLTFTASNGVGSNATQSFTLTVNLASQAPAFTSANKTTFVAGVAGTFQVTATGSPTPTLAENGALPAGVTFNASTGLLTGIPAPGTGAGYALSFTASNGVGSDAVQSFTLFVNQSPSFTSASKATFAVGAAGAFQITVGGFPTAVLTATGALPRGIAFDAATGLLSGTPAPGTGGTYALTFTANNGIGVSATQSFVLTINQSPSFTSSGSTTFTVGSPGSFTVTASGPPSPTLKETGALPSGLTFNAGTDLLSGTPAAGTGGSYPVTFTASNGVGAEVIQNFILTVNQAPAFTSASVASLTEGTPGTFSLQVTGFPVPALGVSGALPAGVTFDAATGLLGGTPAAGTGGNYPLTFTANNGIDDKASLPFVLTIGTHLSFASSNQATFWLAKPNSFTVEAKGFPKPVLFERGLLPAGVTFDTRTGTLSGAPSVGSDGAYPISFTAQNGLGAELTQNFVLLVQATANQHYVTAIYKDLLGHGPDPEGLAYWSDQLDYGDSRVTIINLFDHSTWYYGPIVESVYQKYLGRTPDAGGLAFWIQRMFDGLTDEQLEASLIASPEYFQHAGGANRSWVDAMYQDLLGRQPDSAGEAFWVGQLQLGVSRYSVALGFAASRERESQHLMAEYRKLLGRPAGNQEIDYWLGQFEQGVSSEDILTGLVTSDEYYNKRP
jgi:hypothetical protein